MLRTASRRLSALQPGPPPELPLAAQGSSSLLLLATLRDWSACSTPLHTAAPSSAAAAAAAAVALVPAPSRQCSSSCSDRSSRNVTQQSSSAEEWQLGRTAAGSRAAVGGSSGLRHPGSAAGARLASTAGRRGLHWASAAAASAAQQGHKADEAALKKTVRTLLPEIAVSQYLQDRLGLLEKEAELVVTRISKFSGPEAHGHRRVRVRELRVAQIMSVVDFLVTELDGVDVAALVRRHPHILVDTPVEQLQENCQQLRAEFQLSSQQLARLATKCPILLRADLARSLLPIAALLREWGLNPTTLQSVVLRYPTLFIYRPESIQERLEWLHDELGLSKITVAALVHRYAIVAAYSSAQLEQGRQWLLEMGVPSSSVGRAVARYPQIITYSDNKRNDWLVFMREELGLSQAAVARVLVSQPDMAGRSLDLLRSNLDMWESELRLSPEQLHSMLEANPAILRLDVSSPTYSAKIEYLRGMLEGDDEALARVLAGHPYYLSYRLDRIVTRAEYLKQLGRLRPEAPTGWLACSEPLFASQAAKTSLADFTAFKLNFRSSPEAQRLLGAAQQERMRRMVGRRLEQELAAREATLADAEETLRQRITALEEKDARLAAAEQMLQRREARAAAAGDVPPAAQQEEEEEEEQAEGEEVEQQLEGEQPQQRKLPRLGDDLPDFSGDEWTAAAVKQRRNTLARQLRQLRDALEGLAAAPEWQQAADSAA